MPIPASITAAALFAAAASPHAGPAPAPAQPGQVQLAQAQPAPRGSYLAHCTDIRMNGLFLSAVCRGEHGGGQSSINVASCAGDIGVDASGALSCAGPGAAVLPPVIGYGGQPRRLDARPDARTDARPDARIDRGRGGHVVIPADSSPTLGLFTRRDFKGPATRIEGPAPSLADLGLEGRVRSIGLPPGSGAWLVCPEPGFRGRCVTIERSVGDTARLGLPRGVASLWPEQR